MNKRLKKVLYRAFCFLSFVIAVYLIIDLKISKTLDIKMIIVFILLLIVILWGVIDWKMNNDIIREQEKELMMYRLYIQPMEELVKEIRAKQHEFDNHLNAILHMHLTVDTYDELVKQQSAYISEITKDGNGKYIPLLRITDKVLAGFLYSKITNACEYIETEVIVKNKEIISGLSEHRLIEIVGVLVDNAFEACTKESGKVRIILDSKEDHLIFQIYNLCDKVSLEKITRFFESGYTTKDKKQGKRGMGLYRAKGIAEKAGGEITVGQEMIGGENYIHFTVVV